MQAFINARTAERGQVLLPARRKLNLSVPWSRALIGLIQTSSCSADQTIQRRLTSTVGDGAPSKEEAYHPVGAGSHGYQ